MRKKSSWFPFSFQLSRHAWNRFDVPGILQRVPSDETNPEYFAIRLLAESLNQHPERRAANLPWISAGKLITFGLIQDTLRFLIDQYCKEQNPGSLETALDWTCNKQGTKVVDETLKSFVRLYPHQSILQGLVTDEAFLADMTPEGKANRLESIPELILLSLASTNPALQHCRDLFDDSELKRVSKYLELIAGLDDYYATLPPMQGIGKTLFRVLRSPQEACPDSLEDQLGYILQNWTDLLPEPLRKRMLVARGILREETLSRGPVGGGPAPVLTFPKSEGRRTPSYPEPERFSPDLHWMANVVLIAKSTYVWLDQLSRKYQRPISRLDEIPDEELDRLARWGFTGLWLIGVWERSSASKKIKQIMGNPEALSSAYSLYDYTIAEDLGGEAALQRLKERAQRRGIHLASDMVPNHFGLCSRWVTEHPDWFIQVDHPPFPGYQFTGPDLSDDARVTLQIEDGYWSHRDAAVVFKRIDNHSGHVSYIYHGNDGTHLPWNDTAQLNHLRADVREALIQTILHVARQFPIIRFDAAMTLAKKHYQRLWFPFPGEGGAIPSRSEHSMTQEEFEAHIPEEFWREVVERVAREVPNTLLLAEAFWLMEGYFVRTLGMHRVYNSAFMNMLKMEDNAEYRTTIKNVLEFSPEILKRFVNFMNNPDEKTAVEQFGKDDKYYGVAMMMVTMPGLPMFGHGQIEGFTEKYGMEYRRAYWDEPVDEHAIWRHEQEIFPLMQRRRLFSEVDHFAFYDFFTPEGHVDENVFAYSNRHDGERALILYNNAYNTTQGWVNQSTEINYGHQDHTHLVHKSLVDALALKTGDGDFVIYRDYKTGLEYLRRGKQIAREGLFFHLHAYQYHALLDFRELFDTDGNWAKLESKLKGEGVPDIQRAYREMILSPLLDAMRDTLRGDRLLNLIDAEVVPLKHLKARSDLTNAIEKVLETSGGMGLQQVNRWVILEPILEDLELICQWEALPEQAQMEPALSKKWLTVPPSDKTDRLHFFELIAKWALLRHLACVFAEDKTKHETSDWMEDWLIDPLLAESLKESGRDGQQALLDSQLLKGMLNYSDLLCLPKVGERANRLETLFKDQILHDYLGVNEYEGVTYFSKESFERLMRALFFASTIDLVAEGKLKEARLGKKIKKWYANLEKILTTAEKAGYRTKETITALRPAERKTASKKKSGNK